MTVFCPSGWPDVASSSAGLNHHPAHSEQVSRAAGWPDRAARGGDRRARVSWPVQVNSIAVASSSGEAEQVILWQIKYWPIYGNRERTLNHKELFWKSWHQIFSTNLARTFGNFRANSIQLVLLLFLKTSEHTGPKVSGAWSSLVSFVCAAYFLACHKHNSLPLGPIQPSFPSTDQLPCLDWLVLF